MVSKGRRFWIIVLVFIGALSCFLEFSVLGQKIMNSLIGEFNPNNTYLVKIYGTSPHHSSKISSYEVINRDRYDFVTANNYDSSDIVLSFGEEMDGYKNSSLHGTTTISAVIKSSNKDAGKKSGELIGITEGETTYTYGDYGKILRASLENKTWKDIGFSSSKTIKVTLPKDENMLKIVVFGIYGALDEDDNLTQEDVYLLRDDVRTILENAEYYTSENIVIKEESILIFAELDPCFETAKNKMGAARVYNNKSVFYPIYINWNNSEFDFLIDFFNENPKKSFFKNLDARDINGKTYSVSFGPEILTSKNWDNIDFSMLIP